MPIRPAFLALYVIGVPWALAWWVLDDCRKRGIAVSIDHGWFVFSFWPLVFPYHVLRTRGAGGLLILLGILGMFIAAWLVSLVIWLIRIA